MTFQDDNGNVIEYKGDFSLSKQGVSFLNGFKIKGDVSTSFNLDNNSENRRILGYKGPQMTSQVAWTKQTFSRIRNGNILDRGYIVIQRDTEKNLICFYATGNSSWMQSFQGLITELNWTDYTEEYTAANVTAKVSATSGIVFPMVDWVRNLYRGYNDFRMDQFDPLNGFPSPSPISPIVDKSNDPQKSIVDFYPCLHLKSLVQEIIYQNGFKLSGDLLNDKLYNSLVVSPIHGQMKRRVLKNVLARGAAKTVNAATTSKYDQFTATQDPEGLFSNSRYTSNKKCGLIFTVTVVATSAGSDFDIELYKNGSLLDKYEMNASGAGQIQSFKTYRSVPGDYFEIFVNHDQASPTSVTLNLEIEIPEVIRAGDFVEPSNFLAPATGLEILKAAFSVIGCEVGFNEYTQTIEANIIENIQSEDAEDFSPYYISHEADYSGQIAQNNYLRYADSPDSELKQFNALNKPGYGNGRIETTSNVKIDFDLFKLPFCPSGFDITVNGEFLSNCPLVQLKDTESIAFASITSIGGGQARFTFVDATLTVNLKEIFKVVNSGGQNLGYFISEGSSVTPGEVDAYYPFTGDDSGYIVRQEISYLASPMRLLVNKPTTNYSDFTSTLNGTKTFNSQYVLVDETGTRTNKTTTSFAYFCKKKTGLPIDGFKANCAFLNPGEPFDDPPLQKMYFNKISSMVAHPPINLSLRLPDSVFSRTEFSQFIEIKAKDLVGYFKLDSIEDYRNGTTPTRVKTYML